MRFPAITPMNHGQKQNHGNSQAYFPPPPMAPSLFTLQRLI